VFFTGLIAVIGAYLLGSVNFAVIFTKYFTKKDVRDFGSGNAGSTNALRVGGKKIGILTFVCDFFKGSIATYLGKVIFEYIAKNSESPLANPVYGMYFCALACLIGHIFPLFFGFRGGKGVATGVGIYLVICPISALVGLSAFLIVVLISRMVSLSSIIGDISVIITALILRYESASFWFQLLFCIILGGIVVFKHKENIIRIINKTENKF